MKRTIVLASLIALGLATPAAADSNVAGPDGSGVNIYVPPKWKTTVAGSAGEGVMVAISPDGEATVLFALANAENLEKASAALDQFLGKFITDVKVAKLSARKLNGMPALAAKGTGKAEGKDVALGLIIAQTPTGKVLFVVGAASAAKASKYKKTFDKVLAGIKPAS